MQQSNEFYEDEVVEGFYVPSMVKKAWGAQMDVFNEVDAICTRHNIAYFADWGSLLGTIRHSGYVPWDDDMDICMKRSDYERFLEFAKDELPKGFKVMNFKNHPNHLFFVARIVGKPRICFEEEHLKRFHGFPYIAGIDLFVLDYVSVDRSKEEIKSKIAEFVIAAADEIAENRVSSQGAVEYIKQIERYTGVNVPNGLCGEDLRVFLYDIAERLFSMIPENEADALVQMMPYGMYGNKRYFKKELFERSVRLPYGNTSICVPLQYDTVMRQKFGNYMEIHKNWDGHDYPFFKEQHRLLLDCLDFEYPAFKSDAQTLKSLKREKCPNKDSYSVVVFPFAPKYWVYLKKMYEHFSEDKNATVYVVPIPYYYKSWDEQFTDEQYDIDGYPADIQVWDYREFDVAAVCPDKIVIQNPFDEWNTVTSVPRDFYAKRLRECTSELIYVPFFRTYDFNPKLGPDYNNMDYYVSAPGVIYSDKVILWSEEIKRTYIAKLSEFCDCESDAEAMDILNEKIVVSPELIYNFEDEPIPDKPGYFSNEEKKTVVYFTTISTLAEYGESATEKISSNLKLFDEYLQTLNVVWIAQLCDEENLENISENVRREFLKIRDEYRKKSGVSYVDDVKAEDYDAISYYSDAYYGDPSAIALKCKYRGKPVMIQNINIAD